MSGAIFGCGLFEMNKALKLLNKGSSGLFVGKSLTMHAKYAVQQCDAYMVATVIFCLVIFPDGP